MAKSGTAVGRDTGQITINYPMHATCDPRLATATIRARYNDPHTFGPIDRWHRYTADEIQHQISRRWIRLTNGGTRVIVNAGAGGNDLGVCPQTTINLDISERRLSGCTNPLVASVEALPLPDASVDLLVCVGSVINYCDAAAAISEFGRLLRPNGHLLIEFESSLSAELARQSSFGDSAGVFETFYCGQREVVWGYRIEYVRQLLHASALIVTEVIPIHILSPWMLLFLRDERVAALAARFDRIGRHIPLVTRWASNFLLVCEKEART